MNRFLIFAMLVMTSCVTRKACERKFPVVDSVRVVSRTVTVYRDTVVYVEVPGDTVWRVSDTLDGISTLRTPLAQSYALVKDGRLWHRLEQRDSTVPVVLKGALKSTETRFDTVAVKTVKGNELSRAQWGFIFLGVIVVCFSFLSLKR